MTHQALTITLEATASLTTAVFFFPLIHCLFHWVTVLHDLEELKCLVLLLSLSPSSLFELSTSLKGERKRQDGENKEERKKQMKRGQERGGVNRKAKQRKGKERNGMGRKGKEEG